MSKHPPKWLETDYVILKELWDSGISIEDIALKVNRTVNACKNKLYERGLTLGSSRKRQELSGAAADFVLWDNSLSQIQDFSKKWRSGVTLGKMAEIYGRTPAAIKNRAKDLKLGPRGNTYEESIHWDIEISSYRICNTCNTRRLITTSFSGDSRHCYQCITPTRSEKLTFTAPFDPWDDDNRAIGCVRKT